MEVIALTIFVSLLLAMAFILFFFAEGRRSSDFGGIERDSLLPLEDETATKPVQKSK
jgi:hypothetical protein